MAATSGFLLCLCLLQVLLCTALGWVQQGLHSQAGQQPADSSISGRLHAAAADSAAVLHHRLLLQLLCAGSEISSVVRNVVSL